MFSIAIARLLKVVRYLNAEWESLLAESQRDDGGREPEDVENGGVQKVLMLRVGLSVVWRHRRVSRTQEYAVRPQDILRGKKLGQKEQRRIVREVGSLYAPSPLS